MEETIETTQEKTAPKKLNESRLIGKIEWFNFSIGYGFIIPNNSEFANVFVHKSSFALKEGTTLNSSVIEHRLLEFDIYEDDERKQAMNVTAMGGILLGYPELEVYLMNGVQRRRSLRSSNRQISIVTEDDALNTGFNRWSACYRSFNVKNKRRVSMNEEKSRSGLDENWRERNGAQVINSRNRRRSVSSVKRVNDDPVMIKGANNQLNEDQQKSKTGEHIEENKENAI